MATSIPVINQFSEDDLARIIELFNQGKTQTEIGELFGKPRRTIGKILDHLNLKRTTQEASKIKAKPLWDKPEIVDKIRELRPTHSLPQLVKLLGIPLVTLGRLCDKYGIEVPSDYSERQSKRMIAAWTEDKRQQASINSRNNSTPEVRKKLSESSKALWADPEYRDNQIAKQKIVWADIELRNRMSAILSEYWNDSDRRIAMAAIQEMIWTPEKCAEMSDIQKQIWADPEKRKKMSEVMQIIWADPQLRDADSERLKKIWENQELRQVNSSKITELWKNQDYRKKVVKSIIKALEDPEIRKKMSKYAKERWESLTYRGLMAKVRESQPRVSSIQTTLYQILEDLKIPHFREWPDKPADPECTIGPYNFDCVIPRAGQKSLIIECHGDYWHSQEKSIRVDKSKSTYISEYYSGTHEIKYLWEHEFACKDKIIESLKYWLGIKSIEVRDFNFSDVTVDRASASDYRPLLSKYHYLANAGRGGLAYGAYLNKELIAVCVFSPLIRQNIDTAGFDIKECVELSRLCVHPRYQKHNMASWFVSRAMKLLGSDIKLIISYCDTTFNHDGAVYKALNFQQDRIVKSDYWYTSKDGWVMHKQTLYSKAVRLSMTENEFAEKFEYKRVYGSEKLRFTFKRHQ